jgi:cation:H+ antiporter
VNIMASISGNSDIAIGNVVGSNIANILLILGISAIINPLPIQRNTVISEIPFSLASAILLGFLANAALFDKTAEMYISHWDGLILLFFFALFMSYIFSLARENKDIGLDVQVHSMSIQKSIGLIALGTLALFLGGKWVVDGAVEIATLFGMSQTFIGLTIVAVGTSLPELVTSAVAAYKKNTDIAVGNVIGSNIFNVLWILGVSASISPLHFDVITNADILVLIGASSLLIMSMATGQRNAIDRWNGYLFVTLYVAYVVYLVLRG